MRSDNLAEETTVSGASTYYALPWTHWLALVCLVWYSTVALVCTIGYIQLFRFYSRTLPERLWTSAAPHVTIIRPIKGVEPFLYDCLASTFHLHYPKDKMHYRFCISARDEPCMPVLQRLVQDFPGFDVEILVEEEDQHLIASRETFGPNPKIRNMSRAYREAPSDIVWVIDCNIWVSKGAGGRMVARLEGEGTVKGNKFVHHLPLVIEQGSIDQPGDISRIGGGRFEEAFMSSAHAKFYTAINTVLIAPCIVGKSTMFRRSHLDALTGGQGIDYFSTNICEDHLIGDLLWRGVVPEESHGRSLGKHALCFGDFAVQPIANMGLREYWSRRVRWLRVRKFTVTLATLVEPGTESFLCSAYGAYAATTLPFCQTVLGIPQTWTAFALLWLLSVSLWSLMDYSLYRRLQSGETFEDDPETPEFVRGSYHRRSAIDWLCSWIGRESLTLPIWLWAFYGGTTVEWRGKRFWVGMDMKVHAAEGESAASSLFDKRHSKSK